MPDPVDAVVVLWSEEAVRDLEAIHAFIARNSPRYAATVAGRLVVAVDRLRMFPESGRMVPELADPAVREVIHGSYRIVYEQREGAVEVLTVFRASRSFPLLDRPS
jgi:plasmid stabilization system protein ParE